MLTTHRYIKTVTLYTPLKPNRCSAFNSRYDQFQGGLVADRQLYRVCGSTDYRERLTVASSSPHTRTEYSYLYDPF
jgi:hypothetical protein